jgi:hypothetical protein
MFEFLWRRTLQFQRRFPCAQAESKPPRAAFNLAWDFFYFKQVLKRNSSCRRLRAVVVNTDLLCAVYDSHELFVHWLAVVHFFVRDPFLDEALNLIAVDIHIGRLELLLAIDHHVNLSFQNRRCISVFYLFPLLFCAFEERALSCQIRRLPVFAFNCATK